MRMISATQFHRQRLSQYINNNNNKNKNNSSKEWRNNNNIAMLLS